MPSMFNKCMLLLGFALLIHAAYSAAQRKCKYYKESLGNSQSRVYFSFTDRTYLRITEQEATFLPIDVSDGGGGADTTFIIFI